jgi:predicted phosphoribosyltransferase
MRGAASVLDLTGRCVILVDDGWTGPRAVESAIEALKNRGAVDVVFATPLCSPHVHRRIQDQACIASLYPADVDRWILLDHDCLPTLSREEIAALVGKSRAAPALEPESNTAPSGREARRPTRSSPPAGGERIH